MDLDSSHQSSSGSESEGDSDTDDRYEQESSPPHRSPHHHSDSGTTAGLDGGRGYASQRLGEQAEKKFRTDGPSAAVQSGPGSSSRYGDAFIEQCKYIPLRLTAEERDTLAVLENALDVSDYTDTVDVWNRQTKVSRIFSGLRDVLSISAGLTVASNLRLGEELLVDRNLDQNIPFFRDMFEIGRRYKIMNPSKMRETYGKMMFILQDTMLEHERLGDTFVKKIQTVYLFLHGKGEGAIDLLRDPLVRDATASIDNNTALGESSEGLSLAELQAKTRAKAAAVKYLVDTYTTEHLSAEDIRRVLDSIADNEAYYALNATPVLRMIDCLRKNFDPAKPDSEFSLDLSSSPRSLKNTFSSIYGYSRSYFGGGQKLSHNHETQYQFVNQSLMLWHEVMRNMPKLWMLADRDLIHEPYRLTNTGQGLHRLQQCPYVRDEMSRILRRVQGSVHGRWVGLSVVHLGDQDVPNALVFIDKYSQVPRILAPIASCIERLPSMELDPAFHAYVKQEWGSIEGLRLQILSDFFKHGFDGSGDDGGSCIDGRLTSAWNWCSKLQKKPYYYVFLFTGFQGFDGDWKD